MASIWFAIGGFVSYVGIVLAVGAATAVVVSILSTLARAASRPFGAAVVILLSAVLASATAFALDLRAVRLIAPLYGLTGGVRGCTWLDTLLVGLPAVTAAVPLVYLLMRPCQALAEDQPEAQTQQTAQGQASDKAGEEPHDGKETSR